VPGPGGPEQQWPPGDGPDSPEALRCLEGLRAALLRSLLGSAPAAEREKSSDRMMEKEIVAFLLRHVPDLNDRSVPGDSDKPLRALIVSSYRHGLPGDPEAERQESGARIRRLLAAISGGEESGSMGAARVRATCRRLVAAFEAPHARQKRMLSALLTELAEASECGDALAREVRAWVAERRELALSQLVARLHPDALQDHTAPLQQLAPVAEEYRRRLGGADADPEVCRTFTELFDAGGFLAAVVADVNQPPEAEGRRIDHVELSRWAADNQLGGSIQADGKPSVSPRVAAEIIHAIVVAGASVAPMEEG